MFVVSKLCLQAFTEWFQRKTDGSCTWLWTPYSDEEKEGVFLNLNSQEQASFLPWKQNQPNGGREENFVKIDMNLFQDENKVKFCLNLTKSNVKKRWNLWIQEETVQAVLLVNFTTSSFFTWKDFVTILS